jgi:hypothetical protein
VKSAAAGLAAATTLLATGCSDDSSRSEAFQVGGDCGLGESLPLTSLISAEQLERLLGPGDYTAERGLTVQAGKVPAEFAGQCTVASTKDPPATRLRITLIPKADPAYASYQTTLASGELAERLGDDGYVVSENARDAEGEDATGARAAIIETERVVVLRVLVPAPDRDAVDESGAAIRMLAENLHDLG